MDLLKDSVSKLFRRLFAAAFGGALVSCVYGSVDMAMVGWYQGPQGSATLAVVAPVWNVVYSCGLMAGIGGAVLFGRAKGRSPNDAKRANIFFSAAVALGLLLSIFLWTAVALFDAQILSFFGADGKLLPLARDYLRPIRAVFPCFLFIQIFASFLRNDGSPGLALGAIAAGGVVNIILDWVCIFALDWGLFGADALWLAMPVTELLVAGYVFRRFAKELRG